MTQTHTHLTIDDGTVRSTMTCNQALNDAATSQSPNPLSNPAQQAWRDAVAFVTLRAKDHYGSELHGRLDKAQALVLNGQITLGDGVATVSSATDRDKRYTVNGSCDCPDAQGHPTPAGICQHRLAVLIHQRAYQEASALVELRSAAARPSNESSMPESPVSMNTHIAIDRRQVQVLVRTGETSTDYHRVRVVMQEVLAEHPVVAALPTAHMVQAPLCPEHKTEMKVSKFGGYFCPHKNADGTHCKEKIVA